MKKVVYVITPREGVFDPGERVFREHGVYPKSIHYMESLPDETVVMLHEMAGPPREIRASLDRMHGSVVEYELASGDERTMLQIRYRPSDLTRDLLRFHRRYGVLLEFPLEFVDPSRSSLRVSAIGPAESVRNLVEASREVIDVAVEAVGRYRSSVGRPFAELTERQQEVLLAAVENGYYEAPREATYAEIAEDLDCSVSAVGQVLRRIESKLVYDAVPDRERDSGRGSLETVG